MGVGKVNKLKPLAASALVVVTISFGYSGVGQWVVLPLGALFTAAYIDGKWRVWKPLVRSRNAKFYQALGVTYWVETMLVFALYWLGRGGANVL